MPKNKTHSGAKKRFRVTGTGKVMRERANAATCSSTSRPPAHVASPATSRCPRPTPRRSRSCSASEPPADDEEMSTWHA